MKKPNKSADGCQTMGFIMQNIGLFLLVLAVVLFVISFMIPYKPSEETCKFKSIEITRQGFK
jgi:hypothetical protein